MEACIITSSASSQHVVQTRRDLEACGWAVSIIDAVTPKDADFEKMSSYGKYLMRGCGARHTNAHFTAESAFGCLLAHKNAFLHCVRAAAPLLVLEDNCKILDFAELEECRSIFAKKEMHFLLCHTTGRLSETCPKPVLETSKHVIEFTSKSKVMALVGPDMSTKCYLISPIFAQHMLALMESRIDNLHIDAWLTLEASYLYGAFKLGQAGIYHGKLCKRVKLNSLRIKHSPVWNNTSLSQHLLQSFNPRF